MNMLLELHEIKTGIRSKRIIYIRIKVDCQQPAGIIRTKWYLSAWIGRYSLEAQIGSSINPADQPVFQDISFTGGMWDADANSTMGSIAPGAEQLAFVSVAFSGVNDKVAANGTLVKMTVSTAGFTSGDYSLRLSNILDVIGEDSYFNAPDASPIPADITNGSIHITPEPATVTLLGLGALALLRRRKVA